MIKKLLIFLISFLISVSPVFASSNTEVRIGDNYYETLEEAIANAKSTDVIKLISNVSLNDTLEINKIINIDLNGNNILGKTAVFKIQGGALTVSGKGTIKETEPNYGVIRVIGSSIPTGEKFSLVHIGKDVTLEGWAGIFITHESSKSYDVFVNLEGRINTVSDINGDSGIGIYINGNIKDQNGSPRINILEGAEIASNGTGIYMAGYTNMYINKAYIKGIDSAIAIKSGTLTIDDSTILCTGTDYTPTEGYSNGVKASGTTIQIESNKGYSGDIELNINSGTFKSENSNVIYEYIGKGSESLIKDINIKGGAFISEANKKVFLVSESFAQKHTNFITGGKYSSDPSLYLASDYTSTLDNDLYSVTKSTFKTVFAENKSSNPSFKSIFIVLIIIILLIIIYLKREILKKFINLFRH